MSEDRKLEECVAAIPSRDASPYKPTPPRTKLEKLSEPVRIETVAWLGTVLACACGTQISDGMQAVIDAIPDGEEAVLDGGGDFIFAFDMAAMRLGIDPFSLSLRPERLQS